MGGCRHFAGMESANTCFQLRAQCISISLLCLPVAALAQTGPSDPQIIAAAPTAKINVGARKLAGHDGRDAARRRRRASARRSSSPKTPPKPAFEPQLIKVLQSARFRPAIDATGQPVESSVEMKVELRPSTGAAPKPVAAKPDPQLTDKEKARIRKMTCSDFIWEWDIIATKPTTRRPRNSCRASRSPCTPRRAPRRANTSTRRCGKPPAKALKESADRCRDTPQRHSGMASSRR